MATYVIVHGAWHTGELMLPVAESIASHGHQVHTPTIAGNRPGDGRDTGLEDTISSIVDFIDGEGLSDIILVGHSYGGMVITGVAHRVPERIARLVYLDAFVPEHGESAMDLAGPLAPRLEAMTRDGFMVPTWVEPGRRPPHDVPHPRRTFDQPVVLTSAAAANIPATYILTLDAGADTDAFSPFADRARARGWEVHQMVADHNPHRSALPELMRMLLEVPRHLR